MLIVMYKDIIIDLIIPSIYISINGKSEVYYLIIFESIIKIWINNGKYELSIESIATDSEKALMDTINNILS